MEQIYSPPRHVSKKVIVKLFTVSGELGTLDIWMSDTVARVKQKVVSRFGQLLLSTQPVAPGVAGYTVQWHLDMQSIILIHQDEVMYTLEHMDTYLLNTKPHILDQTLPILVILRQANMARLMLSLTCRDFHSMVKAGPDPGADTLCCLTRTEQINMREADIEIWMALLDISGTIFYTKKWCSEANMANISLAMFVARREGRHLKWMTEEMRATKKVVLEAVKQHYMAINYASEDLKYDHDIIALARADMLRRRNLFSKVAKDRKEPPLVVKSMANTNSPWRSQSALPMARDETTTRLLFDTEGANREQERLRRRLPML
jgi:hypothetical protein